MKFVVICPDGAADWPLASLGNKTPLEAGKLPNLARMAREGTVGRPGPRTCEHTRRVD